ncbi:hypothetical protein VTL71DRAFT_6964 [Oculimacula yallundae]|uniref:Uncharacterized protein n=1 Tax=Oculimacula yallundae TaxID=86028 RepID=A0ABR4BVD9_9HELO
MLDALKTIVDQAIYIPSPSFTEKKLPSQDGKVFIVTGGYQGLGLALVKLLYSQPSACTIYIASRSQAKYDTALSELKRLYPNSHSRIEFLKLDLADLSTIRASAEEFMRREKRLDVLTNNAGLMNPPIGSTTAQGLELQMGTNCVGTMFFTECLLPVLKSTVKIAAEGSVRVTWASSILAYAKAPKGGVAWDDDGSPKVWGLDDVDYGQSKAGSVFLAREAAARWKEHGIVSVSWNPGNLKTTYYQSLSLYGKIKMWPTMFDPVLGAYTELYAGWSPDINLDSSGAFIIPWGRIWKQRADIENSMTTGGSEANTTAEKFWDWCSNQAKEF